MNKKQKIIGAVSLLLIIGAGLTFLLTRNVTQTNTGNTNQQKSALAQALGKDELVIGIDEAFPPSTFKDNNGNYAGIDVDLANEVSNRTGVKVTFKPIEWDNIIPALLNKDIDIIWSGMGVTPERQKQVDFVTYSKGPKGVAFVIAGSNIKYKDDLKRKVIAVQSGSYQEQDLKDGKIIPVGSWKDLVSMASLPEAILDLKIGRVDAVIGGQDNAAYYITKTLNETDKYRIVDVGYEDGYGGIAVRKDEPQVTAELQKQVNSIIKDGTASKITLKWLGVDKYANWQF